MQQAPFLKSIPCRNITQNYIPPKYMEGTH